MKKLIQKNAPHPSEIVKEYRKGRKRINLYKHFEVGEWGWLMKFMKGQAEVTPKSAVVFSRVFNTSFEFWLNLQHNYNLSKASELIKK